MSPYDTIADLARKCLVKTEQIADLKRRHRSMWRIVLQLIGGASKEEAARISSRLEFLMPPEISKVSIFPPEVSIFHNR